VTAIILAAGRGSRLAPVTGTDPKCLATVGGRTLLARHIEALRSADISEIAVVVGCQSDRVRREGGPAVHYYVENTRFSQTNSLYSLWLARPLLPGGAVVLNCDVLCDTRLLQRLLDAGHEDALLVDYRRPDGPAYGDEEMKVEVVNHCVADIGKTIEPERAHGENVGIAKFGVEGAGVLVALLDMLISAGAVHDWAPSAFRAFAAIRPLHVVGTGGLPWTEIDFPEDYYHAVRHVLPLLRAEHGHPRPAAIPPTRIAPSAAPEISLGSQ
jgi:choline kinase